MSATTTTQAPSTTPATVATTPTFRYPDTITFQNAAKISIAEDKPIMMDYWSSSIDKTAIIGVRENKRSF